VVQRETPIERTTNATDFGNPSLIAFDRDGTLIQYIPYLRKVVDVKLIPGSLEAIRLLNEANIPVVVITNQSAVGRGLLTIGELHQIHERMRSLLESGEAYVSQILTCFHTPIDKCICRKPLPSLLQEACMKENAEISRSWVIGDALSDMLMADLAGARGARVLTGVSWVEESAKWPVFVDALAAVRHLLKVSRKRETNEY